MLEIFAFVFGVIFAIGIGYVVIGVALTVFFRKEIIERLEEDPDLLAFSEGDLLVTLVILWPSVDWRNAWARRAERKERERERNGK